jgi:predicted transcriptional regulator of viral defense system
MREIDLWRAILKKNGILSRGDFREAGYHPADIRKFVLSGDAVRIKAGLYKFPEFALKADPLFEVSLIIPKGIFCLGTAASFYGLTTWTPAFYQVAIPRKDKITRPAYPPVELYYWNAATTYSTGVQEVEVNGSTVRMSICSPSFDRKCFENGRISK